MISTNRHLEKRAFLGLSNAAMVNFIAYSYILLFVYAATAKLMDYDKFRIQIGKSPVLTDFAVVLVWLVPVVEIVIAGMLVFKRTMLLGMYASFTLMAMFTAYIVVILNFSDSIPCSCGGVMQKMTWNQHLVFNLVFLMLAGVGILLQYKILQKRGSG